MSSTFIIHSALQLNRSTRFKPRCIKNLTPEQELAPLFLNYAATIQQNIFPSTKKLIFKKFKISPTECHNLVFQQEKVHYEQCYHVFLVKLEGFC